MAASEHGDPVLQAHRVRIAEVDRRILEALNERIDLVRTLKDYKASQGLGFHDVAQEERVIQALCFANAGPMSESGLRELYGFLLPWIKREVERAEETGTTRGRT